MGGTHSQVTSEHKQPLLKADKSHEECQTDVLRAIVFQLNSFLAVLWPVLLTILIASFCAVNVQDPQTRVNMRSYLYYKDIDESADSGSIKTMEALVNAFVIIAFIAAVTFAVVFLYKFNCMKGLVGYLMFSSSVLLGFVGTVLVKAIFVESLEWPIDVYSMAFIMYNFALVGTISIFYQKGIPQIVEKGYLVATSVIMAWQLCQWPEWSAWTILCMLAFWDLFAVLTPCGPLRCLVDMISKEGRPMPGLLYEAEVIDSHLPNPTSFGIDQYTKYNPENSGMDMELLPISHSDEEVENSEPSLKKFEHQIQSFYHDFNPGNMHRSQKLASLYFENQFQLWISLYDKYQVKHTPRNRPYPPASLILYELENISNDRSTIKLGLGDFIFYSVLVGRAAMHSFGTFSACLLSVIVGLSITMYLLTRFQALPALPISILLAMAMFAANEIFIMPLINVLGLQSIMC